MTREKPTYKVAMEFCRAHLGKRCFAPFTGQDWSGWMAFVYLVEMWGRGDVWGRGAAIDGMKAILRSGIQPTTEVMQIFVQTIPAVLDWCHVREIWPSIWQGGHITFAPSTGRKTAAFIELCAMYRDDNNVLMTRDAAEARWRSA